MRYDVALTFRHSVSVHAGGFGMQIVALEQAGLVVALEPQRFDQEVLLQRLLRDYPRLLLAPVGDYQDRTIWTIGYEVGTSAGSVDLLCLDSTGEIWVVEVKLHKNPEAKKQVVGQVLGYASSVATWSADRLEAVAQSYFGEPLVEHLAATVGIGDAERIVETAFEKLKLGDLTAVVVLDDLPTVLQRLVEFVNDHSSFDLLALTVQLYEHDGARLVVPSIIGANATKSVSATGAAEETLDELIAIASPEFGDVFDKLEVWARERGHGWIKKRKTLVLDTSDGQFVLRLYPKWGTIELSLRTLIAAGMRGKLDEIRSQLSGIMGRVTEKAPYIKAGAPGMGPVPGASR